MVALGYGWCFARHEPGAGARQLQQRFTGVVAPAHPKRGWLRRAAPLIATACLRVPASSYSKPARNYHQAGGRDVMSGDGDERCRRWRGTGGDIYYHRVADGRRRVRNAEHARAVSPAWANRARPGDQAGAPSAGYELELIPRAPAAQANAQLSPGAEKDARRGVGRAEDPSTRCAADACWSASADVRGHARLTWRQAQNVPIVVHAANPRPGLENRIGARSPNGSFTPARRQAAAQTGCIRPIPRSG